MYTYFNAIVSQITWIGMKNFKNKGIFRVIIYINIAYSVGKKNFPL